MITDNKQNQNKEVELKHSRIELWISGISLLMSVISLVLSIGLTKSQIDLEYNQSLPNLSMSIEVVEDDTGEEILNCKIKNDGGNIREAAITPHLYLTYSSMHFLGAKDEKDFALEVMDLFAPYAGNGIYYSSDVSYNPDEESWFLNVDKARMQDAFELLFLIAEPLADAPVMAGFNFCLEVRYVDVMGDAQIEWYNATVGFDTGMLTNDSKHNQSFQLQRINKDSGIPLRVYKEAFHIQIGEDLSVEPNEETIKMMSGIVYQELFEE